MHMATTINRLGGELRFVRPWTPREEETLRKDLRTKGYRALALQLKRTVDAVKAKAQELGLCRREGGQ